MLSDASLRTCWFQLAEERASFDLFFFSGKFRVSWKLSTEKIFANREGSKAWSSWHGSRLTSFPLRKIDNTTNFTFKTVSILTITCAHSGCDTFHGGKLTQGMSKNESNKLDKYP